MNEEDWDPLRDPDEEWGDDADIGFFLCLLIPIGICVLGWIIVYTFAEAVH